MNHRTLKIHGYSLSYKRAYFNDFIYEQIIIQYLHVSVMYPGVLFFSSRSLWISAVLWDDTRTN